MPTTHPLMMKASGSRPDDWLKAQLHLVKAALPDAERPQRTPLPLVPLARLGTLQSLLTHTASSATAQATQAATALPALALDPDAVQEAWALAGAIVQRCWSLQAHWLEQWTTFAQELGETRKVNTVAKFVGQEMNLAKLAQTLLADQTTDVANLMENIVVDMGWWVSQKARG